MAQGTVKARPAKPNSSTKSQSSTGVTKKGARTFKTKNVKLAKQQKMTKKFSAGMINQTEKMLGEKAGHLELLAGGRKKGGGDVKGKKGPEGKVRAKSTKK